MAKEKIDYDQIAPELCVGNNLRRITRTVIQVYEEALRPSGITIGQFSTLGSLSAQGPLPLMQLAEVMELDRTTLARNLKLLERDGLVAVEPDPADKRVKLIRMTAEGRAAFERAAPLWSGVQQHFANGLGAELDGLLATFDQLRELASE